MPDDQLHHHQLQYWQTGRAVRDSGYGYLEPLHLSSTCVEMEMPTRVICSKWLHLGDIAKSHGHPTIAQVKMGEGGNHSTAFALGKVNSYVLAGAGSVILTSPDSVDMRDGLFGRLLTGSFYSTYSFATSPSSRTDRHNENDFRKDIPDYIAYSAISF
ncbi:hypothetical protein BJ508DRAFT_334406 [Ascobolus immersus RN42]|uniref:Uncharacterized protein n=1 Tax=Ascobolus immersus RN42 TaxID=1160509 RepID=A0A3N4HJM7_ASCIM|nr:hypothetical protein BJ508DRAFT_334406 [Ascobolus immersus RN42]